MAAPGNDLPLSVGEIVAAKYRIDALIGRGGMGVVFAATHLALGHRVALKVVLAAGARQTEFVARFEQEARAAARLTSPHVARVFDVGVVDHAGEPTPYMVMELLHGETLSSRIRRGRLDVPEAAQYVREICDALGEAHAIGIVHRDLKGDNVFLAQRPNGQVSAKLLDFGISKIFRRGVAGELDVEALTNTQDFLGTPASMPPEQFIASSDVTPKADVWALGVLVFKMLTGRSPFRGNTIYETAENVVRGPTPPLAPLRPDLHPAWSRLLDAMLRKTPEERVSLDHVVRMVNDAERASSITSSSSIPMAFAPSSMPPPGGDGSTGFAMLQSSRAPKPSARRALAIVGALGVLAASGIALGGTWWTTRSSTTDVATDAPPPLLPSPAEPPAPPPPPVSFAAIESPARLAADAGARDASARTSRGERTKPIVPVKTQKPKPLTHER